MSSRQATVREAFAQQAAICARAGAPFTGRLCGLIGAQLDRSGTIGRRVLDWAGVPSHEGDALPLRLAGGLHALARSGRAEALSAVYPPEAAPDDDAVWAVVEAALAAHEPFVMPWLDRPPQTNEVGRSAALMAGLLVLADRFDLPFALYELGASAGLNTLLDCYGFVLGRTPAGDAGSTVRMEPAWTGASPPEVQVRIVRRAAVDRHPLDVTDPATRERLSAYVWADHRGRLARLQAALDLAATDPVAVARGDAADWLEVVLDVAPEPGVCRVVMHTIAYQYFPAEAQARIRRRLAEAGARTTEDAPVAWLSLEAAASGFERRPELVLTVWPGSEPRRLAVAQPHWASIEWLDQAGAGV